MRIGIVAPSTPIVPEVAERVQALAAAHAPDVELVFDPQCFVRHRHFAGEDHVRENALVAMANDPAIGAIWFARGGYGACRIAASAIDRMESPARAKAWLGYSDAGYLLAGLYRAGFAEVAHGPMPQDVLRDGGEAAVLRALAWLTDRAADALEPGLHSGVPAAAFNITVLGLLLGTPLEPDLAGHELLLEDVSEHMYRTDRAMHHLTANPAIRAVTGVRLGRVSQVPHNDPDFEADAEEVVRYWCDRSGIRFLGAADIGHDADNKVVPLGLYTPS